MWIQRGKKTKQYKGLLLAEPLLGNLGVDEVDGNDEGGHEGEDKSDSNIYDNAASDEELQDEAHQVTDDQRHAANEGPDNRQNLRPPR